MTVKIAGGKSGLKANRLGLESDVLCLGQIVRKSGSDSCQAASRDFSAVCCLLFSGFGLPFFASLFFKSLRDCGIKDAGCDFSLFGIHGFSRAILARNLFPLSHWLRLHQLWGLVLGTCLEALASEKVASMANLIACPSRLSYRLSYEIFLFDFFTGCLRA
jgi:hypothetical protein